MHIGILQTDTVRPEKQAEHGDYPDMFKRLLSAADPTLTFATYNIQAQEFPEKINDCDAYIITGSKWSVYDDEPWIHALIAYVQKLHQAKKKVLGICFGHQMLAHALGGRTAKSEKGWGLGVRETRIFKTKPWMQPSLNALNLMFLHQDQVVDLPPNADLLCGNEFCPHGMFQLDDHILAIQAHPEFTKGYLEWLMKTRAQCVGEEALTHALATFDQDVDTEAATQWILAFLKHPA